MHRTFAGMRWVAAVLWVIVAVAAGSLVLPRDTDRRRVQARGLLWLLRWWRSTSTRILLWFVGWPHLLDVLFFGGGGPQDPATPFDVVWRQGKTRLLHYRNRGRIRHPEPVLLVHSTVSKPWILDLTPTRSLVRSLIDAGFDVYLLDWGDPGRKEAMNGLAEYTATLRAAEAAIPGEAVHRVGYCFGASLCLLDADAPHVRSTVLIAPVVDLAAQGGFQSVLRSDLIPPTLALDHDGCVPAAVIRESFHGLRPQALRTTWARLRNARKLDAEYREFYAAMSKWAWRQRRLPGALFFDVVDLHRTNPIIARLTQSPPSAPTLIVMAERDHIVPRAASEALASVPGVNPDVLHTPSGHVSMVVGSAARQVVWPGIAEWLAARQQGVREGHVHHPDADASRARRRLRRAG